MTTPHKYQMLPMEKVLHDPVHNYIHVQHQVILDLINSKEVQRLRRIKQLGTASFTFHGAEHSCFTHLLGVYEVSRRICDIFSRNFPKEKIGNGGWNDQERLVTLCAALSHDVGYGPYSHTFEHIFHTNHKAITVEIITPPEIEMYQILNRVEEDFPEKVASVIQKTYSNPQVAQMISSQIDADRMGYLLRDAYFIGTEYGTFDLTRILHVIRPYEGGIAFSMSGMHAVEDYIASRYQMYVQVYFHPVSRGMEVILEHLLHRAHELYQEDASSFELHSQLFLPFPDESFTSEEYLKPDDGVLGTHFTQWSESADPISNDLAKRFLDHKPLKPAALSGSRDSNLIQKLTLLVEKVGYSPVYYTAVDPSYDLLYDFYRPEQGRHRTQIETLRNDGTLTELSQASQLVAALAGQEQGDERFFFPKEMVDPSLRNHYDLPDETYQRFVSHVRDGVLIEIN